MRGTSKMKITIIPVYNNEKYTDKLIKASVNYIKSEGLELIEFDDFGHLLYNGETKKLNEVYNILEKISHIGFLKLNKGYIHKLKNGSMVKYKPSKKEINEGQKLADNIIKNYL
jgi:hypothetical protein